MGQFLTKNEFPVDGRYLRRFSSLGAPGVSVSAPARQLAEKGANVIIVARNEDTLQEGLAYVSTVNVYPSRRQGAKSPDTQRFHYLSADVTTSAECVPVTAESIAWNHGSPPDIVWCCSGSAHPSLYIDTPPEQFQTMMGSNYFSCAYMAHAVLNAWLRPAAGASADAPGSEQPAASRADTPAAAKPPPPLPARHLVFTGSFVSFYSFAGFTPYSPSKAAVRALSDSLSQEMNLYAAAHPALPRVRVHTDENRVKTDLTKSLEEGDQVFQPEEVARRAIRGEESGEELVPTSTIIRLVMTGVMGGSIRGGFWKGLANTLVGWVVLVVMVFVRWEMDAKVTKWGKEHGPSGMLKKKKGE
ncbi:NAD(P)-binding protein [Xylariaceae sp. FL0662B]|nr:NAD(P)-binding protein [Xylariaceae sp. FL0662B]